MSTRPTYKKLKYYFYLNSPIWKYSKMPSKVPKAKKKYNLLPLLLAAIKAWAAHNLPQPSLWTRVQLGIILSIPFQLVLLVVLTYVSTYLKGTFRSVCYLLIFAIAFLNYERITKRLRAAAGPIAVVLLLTLFIVPHLPSLSVAEIFRLWLNQSKNR